MICNQNSRQNQSNYDRYEPYKKQSHLFQGEKKNTKFLHKIILKNIFTLDALKCFHFLTALSLDTILGPTECQFPRFFLRNSLKPSIILSAKSSPLWIHGDKNEFYSMESYRHTHNHKIISCVDFKGGHQEQQSLSKQNEHLSVINVLSKQRFTD